MQNFENFKIKVENELSKTSRYHPDELDSNLTENNHECSYSPKNEIDGFRRNNALSKCKANPSISGAK